MTSAVDVLTASSKMVVDDLRAANVLQKEMMQNQQELNYLGSELTQSTERLNRDMQKHNKHLNLMVEEHMHSIVQKSGQLSNTLDRVFDYVAQIVELTNSIYSITTSARVSKTKEKKRKEGTLSIECTL